MPRSSAAILRLLVGLVGALGFSCATAIEDDSLSVDDPAGGSSGSAGQASSGGTSPGGGSGSASGGFGVAGVGGSSGTTGTGGSSGKGGSGGSPFGGAAGALSSGGAAGTGTGGNAGSGTAGTGSAGTGGSGTGGSGTGGSGGTGQGCASLSPWANGTPYAAGAHVRGVCNNPGGGTTVCTQGTEYDWTCLLITHCGSVAPGAEGWWTVWDPGPTCN